MVGVAVNIQPDPAQPGLLPVVSAILTDGVTEAVMPTVMLLDVAVVDVAHAAFDVSTQLTASLFARALLL